MPQGEDVFPIPGTKRIKYLEENLAAFHVKLTKAELDELEAVFHGKVGYLGLLSVLFIDCILSQSLEGTKGAGSCTMRQQPQGRPREYAHLIALSYI